MELKQRMNPQSSRRCRVCNRPLKDSDSIQKGIGPVCFKKSRGNNLQMNFEFIAEQEHFEIPDYIKEVTKSLLNDDIPQ